MPSRRGDSSSVPSWRPDEEQPQQDADEGFRLGMIIALLGNPHRRVPVLPVVIASFAVAVIAVIASLVVMVIVDRV